MQQPMKASNITALKLALMLAPLVMSMPFAMDIYTPALPEIGRLFHVSAATMQWTMSSFLIMFAALQLFFGPLSDSLGRRKIGVMSCLIYMAGNITCALSHNIETLITGRLLQAIGTCGMLVTAYSTVRDTLQTHEAAKCYSYLNGMIAFSPLCAPFIGSYLDLNLGWPSTFFALLTIAILGIYFLALLPTTQHKNTAHSFQQHKTIYHNIITHRNFLCYTLVNASGISFLFLFCSLSPYLILRQLGISETNYGYYFCVMGVSILVGSWICSHIVERLGIYRTIMLGSSISLLGGISMWLGYSVCGLSIHNWLWPMLLLGGGGTISMSAASAGAMQPFPKHAGAAAAMFGMLSYLLPPVTASIVIHNTNPSSLALAGPGIVFNAIILILFILRGQQLATNQ